MAEDSDDKTEEPTGKRLQEARNEGNMPQTMEVKAMMSLVLGIIMVGMLAPGMASRIKATIEPFITQPHMIEVGKDGLAELLLHLALGTAVAMAAPFALVIALAILGSIAQTKGFLWVPKKLAPNFAKLNPLEGVKRIISATQLMELVKQLIKLSVLAMLLGWVFWGSIAEFQNLATLDLMAILDYISDKIYWMILITLMMVFVLAVGDYLFQRYRWMEKMKMTKQEVKDEHKQQEGDPQVKAKIKSLRIQRARKRMMAAVPKADVVITNPTHYAVALKYDIDAMSAPVLVAKGVDLIAKRIRDLADEHDVPIVENPPVARALYAAVELDHEIPPEHYKAVAEIIGYVMRLKGKGGR
ncbi:flagellar biosynthesis protein FlhB [Magnetospirillum sp. 64-120]|uniref:flagellar biosynthesis protein FlhB n=1 Tax=Magnetospirillum sp. 64-120 TaxID=1895778 RepID=UPI00092B0811|nr:flagellar biosynthesis protein FlhB [Magnetospirillum sp. 64-120]OJX68057.1 MAG: flagellar biosynthesis protein FlhB [Magnetospirillum sp. 64-120]